MSERSQLPDPRRGILGRATGAVYWLLVVEAAFLLACVPTVVGILFLEPHPSNIPLYALSLLPVGPAFSAAIATMRKRDTDLVVWPRYWKSWVANVRDALWVWVPALVVLTILGMNIAFGEAAGVPGALVIISIVLAVMVLLWTVHALMIASLYNFRARDVARLGVYYLAAKPLVTLGVLSFLVLAVAAAYLVSPWVLVLTASIIAALLLTNARAMLLHIEDRFIAGGAGAQA